jgi:hypothetical protein
MNLRRALDMATRMDLKSVTLQEMLDNQDMNEFIDKYEKLDDLHKEQAVTLLKSSLENARLGFDEISRSYSDLEAYIRFQEELLTELEDDEEETTTNRYRLQVVNGANEEQEEEEQEQNVDEEIQTALEEDQEENETNQENQLEDDDNEENDEDNNYDQNEEENSEDNEDNEEEASTVYIIQNDEESNEEDDQEFENELDSEDEAFGESDDNNLEDMDEVKRERGRASKISELVSYFNLSDKAETDEEEIARIKRIGKYNQWYNIGDERNPHQVIMNATYLSSVQFLEANSKNANFSVLTRVMLNPSGAFFEGESVVIRNRYLDSREEAMNYMKRQMDKIQKQFFYEKAPAVIPNHGNRNSYYGFYLSRENRKNYKEVLQELEN